MLEKFIEQYYPAISDRIEQQQITYGLARIHSHRHISRCIIYSDWYADLLNIGKDSIERMQLYFAIGFHDIGRQGELEEHYFIRYNSRCRLFGYNAKWNR